MWERVTNITDQLANSGQNLSLGIQVLEYPPSDVVGSPAQDMIGLAMPWFVLTLSFSRVLGSSPVSTQKKKKKKKLQTLQPKIKSNPKVIGPSHVALSLLLDLQAAIVSLEW